MHLCLLNGGKLHSISCITKNENSSMEEEKNMTGWNAITDTFLKLYPKQTESLHFAPLFSYRLGGDTLDNINVYESDDLFHFVSYGLSELYEKNPKIRNIAVTVLNLL